MTRPFFLFSIYDLFVISLYINHYRIVHHELPAHWNAFVYITTGSLHTIHSSSSYSSSSSASSSSSSTSLSGPVSSRHIITFTPNSGSTISLQAGSQGATFALAAGEPINEEVVQYGPMVMSTHDEIRKAFYDYQHGVNGFEGAHKWSQAWDTKHGMR